jgi:hypothetical protein
MAHQYTYDELHERLDEAKQKVELNAHYRHVKSGGEYTVVDFVTLEATEEIAVVYQSDRDAVLRFVRPLDDFIAMVEINGQKTPRFVRVAS